MGYNGAMSTEQLTQAAIALPEPERRKLIHLLLDTLPNAPEARTDEEALELALMRAKQIDDGTATPVPYDQAMAEARRRLR